MATQPRIWYSTAISVGRIVLFVGAIICLLAALGVLKNGDTVNVFELGVGLAFLGLAIG